jgi:PAS domain S-box-containing protein
LIVPNEFIEEATDLTNQTNSATIVTKETIRKRRDGSKVSVQITGVPIMIDERLTGYYAMYEDITQRKESQEAFERLSRKNELILGSAAEGILGLDLDGNHTFVNEAAAKMFGYPAQELIGKNSHTTWHHTKADGAPYQEHKCPIYEVLRNGIFSRVDTEVFWRKDGTSFPVEYSSTPIYAGNNIIGAVVIFADITERKRAEKLQVALYKITKVTDISPTLDILFKNVHNIIKEIMSANNFYIALYNGEKEEVSFPYFVDEVDPPMDVKKPGKGLTEYVIFNSKSILCDEELFQEMLTRGEVESIGSPSPIWLGVPLIVNNKTIGMMAAQHYSDATVYGRRELEIFNFVSDEIARVIEKRIAEEEEVRLMNELKGALANVKTLNGLLPICASCKNIRDDKGYWQKVEGYIMKHTEANFTHGICPDCIKKLYPDQYNKITNKIKL